MGAPSRSQSEAWPDPMTRAPRSGVLRASAGPLVCGPSVGPGCGRAGLRTIAAALPGPARLRL